MVQCNHNMLISSSFLTVNLILSGVPVLNFVLIICVLPYPVNNLYVDAVLQYMSFSLISLYSCHIKYKHIIIIFKISSILKS